jgi:GNAT superfamily N-acetyltransferase
MKKGVIKRPELLDSKHNILDFNCGNETLNDWLKKKALKNQKQGASKTFVICDGKLVVGYYALATGSVERINAPKSLTRNMPNPIPVIVLGRLAIDQQFHGKKLGSALLKDVIRRTIFVSDNVGVKALLVHAISEEAKRFYVHHNFIESPIESMTLLLSMNNKKKLEDL